MRARILLAALIGLALVPTSAAAHADPRSVVDAGDGAVAVTFAAPVEAAFLRAGPGIVARRRSDDAHVVLLTAPAGTASTSLRVLSRDGHVSRVTVQFPTVDPGSTYPRPERDGAALIAGRGLTLAGLIALLGLAVTTMLVVGGALRAPIRRMGEAPSVAAALAEQAGRTLAGGMATRRGVWSFAAAAVVGGLVLQLAGMVAAIGDGIGSVGTLLGSTRWGHAWLLQLAMLAAAGGVMAALGRRGEIRSSGTVGVVAVGVPLAVALGAISWAGHAVSGTDPALGWAFDWIHLVATGLWLGGLVALFGVLSRLRRAEGEVALRAAAGVVVRFSAMAIGCVAALVVTGVYRALAELREFGDLIHTGYGKALLVKLGLFVLMLAVAAYNRIVLHTRLERAAIGLNEDDRGAFKTLRRSVRAELVLAAVVLSSVAVLVSLPPP